MTEIPHASPVLDPSLTAGSLPPAAESRLDQLGMDLLSQQSTRLDLNASPIYSASEIGLAPQAGEHEVRVLAELALPGHEGAAQNSHVAVLQVANHRGEVRYALQGLQVDETGKASAARTRVVPIELGTRTLLGSAAEGSAHEGAEPMVSATALWGTHGAYSKDVSPIHLEFIPDTRGGLTINDVSKTGTGLLHNKERTTETHFNPHVHAAYDLGIRGGLIKDGKFAGRPIIDSYTTVGGGAEPKADIASWAAGGEALVVGPAREQDKQAYDDLKAGFMARVAEIKKWNGGQNPSEADVLKAIAGSVSDKMEYDLDFANSVTEQLSKRSPEARKVNLSLYLHQGKGVCRHMADAAAWLGGEAKSLGLLNGKTLIQGNQRRSDNAAHQWARYRDREGQVWIMDPTLPPKSQVQRLEDAVQDPQSWYLEEAERFSLQRKSAVIGQTLIENMPSELFDQEKQ